MRSYARLDVLREGARNNELNTEYKHVNTRDNHIINEAAIMRWQCHGVLSREMITREEWRIMNIL